MERPYLQRSKKKVSKKNTSAGSRKKKPARTKPPETLPKGVQLAEMGFGEDSGKVFYRKGGEWHDEDEARELQITHSTLPTKVKHD